MKDGEGQNCSTSSKTKTKKLKPERNIYLHCCHEHTIEQSSGQESQYLQNRNEHSKLNVLNNNLKENLSLLSTSLCQGNKVIGPAMLDLVLTNKEKLMNNKFTGNLGCSDYEMVEFKILRGSKRVCRKLATLDLRRADFELFRELHGRVTGDKALEGKKA